MEKFYAQALWKAIEKGSTPKDAVASLAALLKKEGREELMPRIKRSFLRLVQREKALRPRLYVAHEKDSKRAQAESGVHNAEILIDDALIGGWRLETAEELFDKSFKNHLLSIYSNVTA